MVIQVCTAPDLSSKVNMESHTTTTPQDNITNESLLQLKTDGETSIEQNTYFAYLNVFLHPYQHFLDQCSATIYHMQLITVLVLL